MKKALKITAITLLLLFFFKGFLYRQTINYTPIKEIEIIPLRAKKVIIAIEAEAKNKPLNLQTIAVISSNITNQFLQFTFERASNSPNQLAHTGKANCVGYSAMYGAVADYLITKHDLSDQIEVKHMVGKMDFLGLDLHQFFTSSFYKNHDYNIIENKTTGTIFLIDSSLNDYLYLGGKSIKL